MDHNAYQQRYFEKPERTAPRMAPVRTRSVLNHLARTLDALQLPSDARVLELGCGMGRFSLLLAERGFRVTAVDLSPDLLAVLREHDPGGAVETVCCDAVEVGGHVEGSFDAAVGFFFLHHLSAVEPLARTLARQVRPGGRVAFCEPNAFNPSFYLQVLLTPGMSFRGDGGIVRMRPGVLRPALETAGFSDVRIERYGLFPPLLGNTRAGAAVEQVAERVAPARPLLAFQVVSATRDG